jgi:small GTP-binding protein
MFSWVNKLFPTWSSEVKDSPAVKSRTSDIEALKIVFTGDAWVGKTSIIHTFKNKAFAENFISIDFAIEHMRIEGHNLKLQMWDTGPERFRTITVGYYRNIHRNTQVLCVVYNITDRISFNNVSNWIEDVVKHESPGIITIVGNKMDLTQQRQVSEQEGRKLANSYGALFIETTAKEYMCIYNAFYKMAQAAILKHINGEILLSNGDIFASKDYRNTLWQLMERYNYSDVVITTAISNE